VKAPGEAVVIVGHSQGASSAVKAAKELGKEKIKITLVVTIDPVGKKTIPSNVSRALNLYQTEHFPTGYPVEAESSDTEVTNTRMIGLSHTELDNYITEQEAFINQILLLSEPLLAEPETTP
jgi:pyruvate/2-oxoglutarate/acetoin dehydrogenase E1 component